MKCLQLSGKDINVQVLFAGIDFLKVLNCLYACSSNNNSSEVHWEILEANTS